MYVPEYFIDKVCEALQAGPAPDASPWFRENAVQQILTFFTIYPEHASALASGKKIGEARDRARGTIGRTLDASLAACHVAEALRRLGRREEARRLLQDLEARGSLPPAGRLTLDLLGAPSGARRRGRLL